MGFPDNDGLNEGKLEGCALFEGDKLGSAEGAPDTDGSLEGIEEGIDDGSLLG